MAHYALVTNSLRTHYPLSYLSYHTAVQITTVEIGLDILGGSDLLAWRQDMQLASAAPGGAAAVATQAEPSPTVLNPILP